MSLYEVCLIAYFLLWLIAIIDAAIGKFSRWYVQLAWLFAIFLIPFGNLIYLLWGCRQVVSGGLGILHKK